MTSELSVLFAPKNVNVHQEKKNGSHLVNVTFESNPPPSAGNVSFTLQRTEDCEVSAEACQPLTVQSGSVKGNFNATPLHSQVSKGGVQKFLLNR